jgi:hypothetical protein
MDSAHMFVMLGAIPTHRRLPISYWVVPRAGHLLSRGGRTSLGHSPDVAGFAAVVVPVPQETQLQEHIMAQCRTLCVGLADHGVAGQGSSRPLLAVTGTTWGTACHSQKQRLAAAAIQSNKMDAS